MSSMALKLDYTKCLGDGEESRGTRVEKNRRLHCKAAPPRMHLR